MIYDNDILVSKKLSVHLNGLYVRAVVYWFGLGKYIDKSMFVCYFSETAGICF